MQLCKKVCVDSTKIIRKIKTWKHFFKWEALGGDVFFQNCFQVWEWFRSLFWDFCLPMFGVESVFFSFIYLASFYEFSVVFLCILLWSVCWLLPPRTCATSKGEFKYFFKRVSCFRCLPRHYPHTSSVHFAWMWEH